MVDIDAIKGAALKKRWTRACLKMPSRLPAPEVEEPKPDLKRKLIMKKLLKGSLVAAFLALGMWASQVSAGDCDCPGYTVPSGVCDPSIFPDPNCGPRAFEEECCE